MPAVTEAVCSYTALLAWGRPLTYSSLILSWSPNLRTMTGSPTTSRTSVRAARCMMMQVGEQPRVGRRLGLTSPDSSDDSEDEGAPQGQPVRF